MPDSDYIELSPAHPQALQPSEIISCQAGDIKLFRFSEVRYYYCFCTDNNFLYVRNIGSLPQRRIRDLRYTYTHDKGWQEGVRILSDTRWTESVYFFDQMSEYVKKQEKDWQALSKNPGDICILCGSDVKYGSIRIYEALSSINQRKVHPVRSLGEAVEALKINSAFLNTIVAKIDEHESQKPATTG